MHSQILPWNDLESHDLLDSQIFSYRPFIRDHFRLRQDTSQLTHFLGLLRCWKFRELIRPGQWSLSRKLLVSWQIWPTLPVWKPKGSHMRSPFHALTPGRQCKKCILFISSFVMFCLVCCCCFLFARDISLEHWGAYFEAMWLALGWRFEFANMMQVSARDQQEYVKNCLFEFVYPKS